MIEAQAQAEGFGETILAQHAPVYFATPRVHLPDDMFDAKVGHELLKHCVLTLDSRANRAWLVNCVCGTPLRRNRSAPPGN